MYDPAKRRGQVMDLGARGLDLVVMVMTHVAPSGTVLLQHINMPIHIVHRKAGTRSSGGLLAERETSADSDQIPSPNDLLSQADELITSSRLLRALS